ncbi:hypothetical protein CEXT_540341 [Caerostris extrusa]|uniref:Uncharacterized protein n=1 Tax=Caerostris extrusa TaxID=172846 RepID=A0AAV4QLS5_CAEEX|nr:hypothetical protein CEXT_540341 [Caerostris extrusa]
MRHEEETDGRKSSICLIYSKDSHTCCCTCTCIHVTRKQYLTADCLGIRPWRHEKEPSHSTGEGRVWLTRSEIGKGVSSSPVSKRKLPCQQITAHPLSARPLPPHPILHLHPSAKFIPSKLSLN